MISKETDRLRYFLDCADLFERELPDGTPLFHTNLDAINHAPSVNPDGKNLRFGHMMELYFSAWLASHPHYEVLAQNIQLISEGVTLGEIDFLVKDSSSNELLHIELAYKFYLLKHVNGSPQWIGPNAKDTLEAKLYRLRHHQFPLLRHPLFLKVLQQMGLGQQEIRQLACLKGQLFLPQGYKGALPAGVNPEAVAGTWTRFNRMMDQQGRGVLYCLPAKLDWLLPPFKGEEWMEPKEAMAALEAHKRPQLCWTRHSDGTHERIMVLPNERGA